MQNNLKIMNAMKFNVAQRTIMFMKLKSEI